MKCKYCGGDVSLDDRYCPHCGREVDQAVRHLNEMEHYENAFEKTREEALEKTKDSSSSGITTAIGLRLGLLVVLIIAFIVSAFRLDPYSVNERKIRREITANVPLYKAKIETMLNERDYAALSALNRKYNFEYEDEYKQYRYVLYPVDRYYRSYLALMEIAYRTDDSDTPYYTESLASNVSEFYAEIDPQRYERYADDSAYTAQVHTEMEEEMQKLLRRYLGLTQEEAASLRTMSKSRRTVTIESALDRILNRSDSAGETQEGE